MLTNKNKEEEKVVLKEELSQLYQKIFLLQTQFVCRDNEWAYLPLGHLTEIKLDR